ncbi:SGNH/GDSL hydrolase family protein [Granulicella sp. dw_53]|uniref:SGNH/GDSL hydrolase family protein n=1 Tax=Granulicella sp. dw_53 TaxID=2719792 RepID=UPI001BD35EF1|nr:SGNH/GDSL hydrolase family protein [Granulicella sp. dw_53]
MTRRNKSLSPLLLLLLPVLTLTPFAAAATPPDHWVGTWAASPIAVTNPEGQIIAPDTTLREIVRVSLGGPLVRVIFSNEFGLDPLTIGAARIALSASQSEVSLPSTNILTFGGHPTVTIPPGALILSDPVALKLPAFADVAVSLYLPEQPMRQVTVHSSALQTSYAAPGNVVGAKQLDAPKEIFNWPILKGIDVKLDGDSAAIVTLGDSITDGAQSTRNTNARWPNVLAARLQANKKTAKLAVLNEGIGGNRLLHDVAGPSALARFDRDVLAQAGVKYLIFLEGINDIGHATNPVNPDNPVTADELIAALGQIAERAHTHGIKVIGATLTPYIGAKYASPEGEAMRQAINKWIRTTNQIDGVIDFEKATQDPANPAVYSSAADSGDHLHPANAGYKLMGDSIDLKLFEK